MNLRQITDAVTETAAHGVMIALLGAHQHYAQWVMEHGQRTLRPQDLQQRSRNNWGIVQKQERGLYLVDADVKDIMRYEGVSPDTLIFPSRMVALPYPTLRPSSIAKDPVPSPTSRPDPPPSRLSVVFAFMSLGPSTSTLSANPTIYSSVNDKLVTTTSFQE